MKVIFYGRLADLFGKEVEWDAAVGSIAELRRALVGRCPESAAVLTDGRSRACVAGQFVPDSHVLEGSEEVEFLAPVSGG